jgi:chromosome partitioning protein
MPIIALVGNKGGAGKTTLSVNIAAGIARNRSTAVLDADPQGSSLQWRAFTEDENALDVYEANGDLSIQIDDLKDKYDCLVIDCPPSVHAPQTNTVLRQCDIALIPVQPSPVDLWATVHTERAIEDARTVNPGLRAMLILNQLEVRTTLSKLVREAAEEIELPVAKTGIRRRAIYRNSALEGKSVFDLGRRGADAVDELNNLLEEVMI